MGRKKVSQKETFSKFAFAKFHWLDPLALDGGK
jgi:hypothetical protein